MKLNLSDRRAESVADLAALRDPARSRIDRLVAGIGRTAWPVNLVLVSDEEMVALNHRYRDRPEATDVLSFSYLQPSGEGRPDLPRGRGHAAHDLWREQTPDDAQDAVGEVVLAPGFVADRCATHAWPLETEIPWLVVHGCLHLVGWDHEEPAERAAMQELEVTILAGEGLEHPLRQRS